MTKGVDERIAERAYVGGMCGGSSSMVRPQKRWIDTVKDCLRMSGKQREWWRMGVNGGRL